MARRLRSAVFLLGLSAASTAHAQAPERYAALIEAARKGDYAPALERLEWLHRRGEANAAQLADLTLIEHWASRHREAIEVFREIAAPPDWLLLPVARSALDLGDTAMARDLATRARGEGEDRYERAGVLAECFLREGDAEAAFRTLQAVLPTAPPASASSAVARLYHERQALAIRRAESLQGTAPRDRVTEAQERALALNAEALEAETRQPELARLTRFDRLVALRDRHAMKDVMAEWEGLPDASREQAPAYAIVAVADALLYLHRPREARALYERAIAHQREAGTEVPMHWRSGLYYALLESEEPEAARREVESLVADAGQSRDPGMLQRARLLAALDYLYADELDAAQRELEALRRDEPVSSSVRAAWVRLLAAREQPRAAYGEAQRLQHDDPDAGADVLLAGLAFELHRWDEARDRLAALLRDDSTDTGVQKQAGAMARHDAWTLRVETVLTRTHGPDPREPSVLAQLYGPPVAEHARLFGFESYIPANAREGAGPRHRAGAGLEWRDGDWTASADANHDNAGVRRNGMDLRLERALTDHHVVAADYEANTRDLSVRAFVNRIYADAYGARYVYSPNESRKLLATVREVRFSDGNRRTESGLEWRERLFSDARTRVDASLAAGATRNSEQGRPYFNPSWDQSVQLGLAWDRLAWREYGRSFRQRVAAGAGLYRQAGFGAKPYGEVRYSHEWDSRDAWNLAYGVGYAMHPYDGEEERAPFAFLNFSWYPR